MKISNSKSFFDQTRKLVNFVFVENVLIKQLYTKRRLSFPNNSRPQSVNTFCWKLLEKTFGRIIFDFLTQNNFFIELNFFGFLFTRLL